MTFDPAQLPDDIATLKALLGAEHAARIVQSELGRLQHQLERVTDADRT